MKATRFGEIVAGGIDRDAELTAVERDDVLAHARGKNRFVGGRGKLGGGDVQRVEAVDGRGDGGRNHARAGR